MTMWPFKMLKASPSHYLNNILYLFFKTYVIFPFIWKKIHSDHYKSWTFYNKLTKNGMDDLIDYTKKETKNLPKISVIMPVWHPNIDHFQKAIQSLVSQIYENWELCICVDGPQDQNIYNYINGLTSRYSKILVENNTSNQGISAATNRAASRASGDIFLFFDQDDLLSQDCLAEFAVTFNENPNAQLVYCDHDKFDTKRGRYSPHFKPGWSPILLLSYMYLGHAIAVRKYLFEQLGGFDSRYDGSQDFEFALRASEHTQNIVHIPRILYHWRVVKGSTALSGSEKPTSVVRAQEAIASSLQRRMTLATVRRPEWAEHAHLGLFELRFDEITSPISIIIILDGTDDSFLKNIPYIIGDKKIYREIIFIDRYNLIHSNTEDILRDKYTVISFIKPNFVGETLSGLIDRALPQISCDFLVVISGHLCPLTEDWICQLVGYGTLPSVGLASPQILGPSGRIQGSGVIFPYPSQHPERAFAGGSRDDPGYMYFARVTREYEATASQCFLVSRDILCKTLQEYDKIDGYSELSLHLSDCARELNRHVLVCSEVKLRMMENSIDDMTDSGTRLDRYYNINMGSKDLQFRPVSHSPSLRSRTPLKLAVISHNLDQEGAQTTLVELLKGLVEAGVVSPTIISSRDGKLAPLLHELGCPIRIVPAPRRRMKPRELAAYENAIQMELKECGAELVLANTLESFAAINVASQLNIGSLWWQHEGGDWNAYLKRWPSHARRKILTAFAQAYRVVQVAEATRRQWLPLCTRSNFEVVRAAIPSSTIAEGRNTWTREHARHVLGLKPEDICLLSLGSISPRKGQADLIKALARADCPPPSPIKSFIVGAPVDAEYAESLRCLATSFADSEELTFDLTGAVRDPYLYMSAADLFVCCSYQESAPRSIMEAMHFGIPVIATSVDGIPELVKDGISGKLVSPGDLDALWKTIFELSGALNERKKLGQNGRTLITQLGSHDEMVQRFATLLRQAAWTGGAEAAGTY